MVKTGAGHYIDGARSTPAPDRSFQRQVNAIPRIAAAAAMKYAEGRLSSKQAVPKARCRRSLLRRTR